MIRNTCLALIAVAALAWTTQASAQGSLYMGPHLGLQTQHDASESDPMVGATARLKFVPFLGADAMISYRQDDMAASAGTMRTWPIMVSGLIYPLPFIYGGAGVGWHHTTFDLSDDLNNLGFDDETQTEVGWHLAVGAEVPATSWLKLMADVRWVYLGEKSPDLPDVISGDVPDDYRMISLGMLFGM